MSQLTHERFLQLQDMGREPIRLPAEIHFGGNERLQKTPGNHHLPKYRKSGTWDHPLNVAQRKRVVTDQATRLLNGTMSEVTLRKIGGLPGLQKRLEEFNLRIDEDQWSMMETNAESLDLEYEAKKHDRDEFKKNYEEKTGNKLEALEPEPVNPREDVVKQEIQAKNARISPQDDLRSGDENAKEGISDPSESLVPSDRQSLIVEEDL